MTDGAPVVDVDALAASVTKQVGRQIQVPETTSIIIIIILLLPPLPPLQGAVVKQMKKDGAGVDKLEPEVAKLVALKAELDVARKAMEAKSDEKAFNRLGR